MLYKSRVMMMLKIYSFLFIVIFKDIIILTIFYFCFLILKTFHTLYKMNNLLMCTRYD